MEPSLDRLEAWRARQEDLSIFDYLNDRALGAIPQKCVRQAARRQYVNIGPNATIRDEESPTLIKRFSPSGRYLVGFGKNNRSVALYSVNYDGAPPAARNPSSTSRFDQFFPVIWETTMTSLANDNLCKDFCLFTPDERFMIVASAQPTYGLNGNQNEEHTIGRPLPSRIISIHKDPPIISEMETLDNVTFHLIEVASGRVTDRIIFMKEYIQLGGHAGISMNGFNLAILCLYHQQIRIFHVTKKGLFVENGIIGNQLDMDEEMFQLRFRRSHGIEAPSIKSTQGEPAASGMLSGIKYKLFSYLHSQALAKDSRSHALRVLYYNWQQLQKMVMQRMQYMGSSTFLIKFGFEEAISSRGRSMSDVGLQQSSFYVFYDAASRLVTAFHRSTDPKLCDLLRDRQDEFRIAAFLDEGDEAERGHCWQTMSSNHIHERNLWERHVQLLTASKPHIGETYAVKRLVGSLPFAPQTYSDSPFVDASLFRFDERHISSSDRHKIASEYPVRLFSRKSDRLCLRLDSSSAGDENSASSTTFKNKYQSDPISNV